MPTTTHPPGEVVIERLVPGSREWERMHADHLARYFYATSYVKGKRVLDAGTGPGYGAAILADAGAALVQAVDIDQETIDEARRNYAVPNLNFLVDDCETLSQIQPPIDVICSFENIEHLKHPERFLESAARLLAEDGVLLVSTPDREGPYQPWKDGKPNNPFHVMEWYRDEFRELLSQYFGEVDLKTQVITHAALIRSRAAQGLREHLDYLWSNPVQRALRGVQNLLGHRRDWPNIIGLDVPGVADYPIVSALVVKAAGMPFCHYGICRSPRK